MEDLCVSPLIQAVQRLDVHSVGALVAKGARVSNARIASRMPASRLVRLACDCTLVRRRHILLLHSMLAGAKQRELDCGLHEVAVGDRESANCQKARLIIAKILVAKGALPDNRQHGCGGTPLHHSLAGGYIELVDYLVSCKADINAANRYGVHPLHIAVKREFVECIAYLMTRDDGAGAHALPLAKVRDELAWAVQYDLPRAVLSLLVHGAPHGMRVVTPWTSCAPRSRSTWDFSLPLGYYAVMRGWRSKALYEVLSKGWSPTHASVGTAEGEGEGIAAALIHLDGIVRTEPSQLVRVHSAGPRRVAVSPPPALRSPSMPSRIFPALPASAHIPSR